MDSLFFVDILDAFDPAGYEKERSNIVWFRSNSSGKVFAAFTRDHLWSGYVIGFSSSSPKVGIKGKLATKGCLFVWGDFRRSRDEQKHAKEKWSSSRIRVGVFSDVLAAFPLRKHEISSFCPLGYECKADGEQASHYIVNFLWTNAKIW